MNDRRGREVKFLSPKYLRSISKVSVEEFKEKLGKYLQHIPDEHNVEGLTPSARDMFTAAPSNSIVDQSRTNKLRRPGA